MCPILFNSSRTDRKGRCGMEIHLQVTQYEVGRPMVEVFLRRSVPVSKPRSQLEPRRKLFVYSLLFHLYSTDSLFPEKPLLDSPRSSDAFTRYRAASISADGMFGRGVTTLLKMNIGGYLPQLLI